MRTWRVGIVVVGVWLLAACATRTPGARPHELSVAGHEAIARGEESAAAALASRRDLAAGEATRRQLAEEHRLLAAEHRRAARVLIDDEARACAGVAEPDRAASPFEGAVVVDVEPLAVTVTNGFDRLLGATVRLQGAPGMTVERLQRLVDCHLARSAVLGHVMARMPHCPLVPDGAEARVSSAGAGLAVAIRSSDETTARRILVRAERLLRYGAVEGTTPRSGRP